MEKPKSKFSKTEKYFSKLKKRKIKIPKIRKDPCPYHYFTGDHFVKKDCDLDKKGCCALCGQRFDSDGEPITIKTVLSKTARKYLYEKIFFCPKAEF